MGFSSESITNESNVDEYSNTERIIRTKFEISLPSYPIQTQLGEKDEHLVHKFTSAPQLSFTVYSIDEITNVQDLLMKNPLQNNRNLQIEDGTDIQDNRPREKRKSKKVLTKQNKRSRVGESEGFFSNKEELLRFFK